MRARPRPPVYTFGLRAGRPPPLAPALVSCPAVQAPARWRLTTGRATKRLPVPKFTLALRHHACRLERERERERERPDHQHQRAVATVLLLLGLEQSKVMVKAQASLRVSHPPLTTSSTSSSLPSLFHAPSAGGLLFVWQKRPLPDRSADDSPAKSPQICREIVLPRTKKALVRLCN